MSKQAAVRYNHLATQKLVEQGIVQNPFDHPSAFVSIWAPEELTRISEVASSNADFLSRVENLQLGDLLRRYAQEYAPLDQDRYEWARIDFENDVNLEVFRGKVGEMQFFVTRPNFGDSSAQVTMTFSAMTAEALLDKLGVAGCFSLELQRHGDGIWSLKADGELFVIEDLGLKVEKDLDQMDHTGKTALANHLGVDLQTLPTTLQARIQEVGYAPY